MSHDDCDDALNELYRFLDGELDHGVRIQIEVHLRHCSPCLEAYDFEAELKRLVHRRCRDRLPDEVRARLLDALSGELPPPD